MKYLNYSILFGIVSVSSATLAEEKVYKNRYNTCIPTKRFMNNYEPEKFASSNNLLRAPGAVPMFCGQEIVVRGKVVDPNCVPIPDAKVYIWQAGCDGKYPYKPLRTGGVNMSMINIHPISSFQ